MRSKTSLPREVIVLGLIAFCVAVGFGVLVPVLPVFARNFGVGNFEVSVAARLNTDKTVQNETIFNPDQRVERSTRAVRETENRTGRT